VGSWSDCARADVFCFHHQPVPDEAIVTCKSMGPPVSNASERAMGKEGSESQEILERPCRARTQTLAFKSSSTAHNALPKKALADITSRYHKIGNRPSVRPSSRSADAHESQSVSTKGCKSRDAGKGFNDEDAVIQRHINVWQGLSVLQGECYGTI
jgi:hypothetical protein